jgi:DNA-binding MarR family transcriptional regulator
MSRTGANLALLLLGSFRSLADEVSERLAACGYEDFRPAHDFAMRAIAAGADNASALGRRLSITKQAAAKTIVLLEDRGYVDRDQDAVDARRKRLRLTPRGIEVLRTGEEIFNELRSQWADQIGLDKLEMIESLLAERFKIDPDTLNDPNRLTHDAPL